jgi:hypothetical protein
MDDQSRSRVRLFSRSIASAACRKVIALTIVLVGHLGSVPIDAKAEGLECPEMGKFTSILSDPAQARLATSGNSVDVANEVYDLINRLQIEKPNISDAELTDVLIAAYCQAVAHTEGLSTAQKWRRMRQFEAIVRRQLAADMMPPGSLIIANVPLPPAVYRELRSRAAAANQTPAQFMGTILSRAAGR